MEKPGLFPGFVAARNEVVFVMGDFGKPRVQKGDNFGS